MIQSVLHEKPSADSTAATVQRVCESFIVNVNPQGYSEQSNALFCNICRAVFNYMYCQVKVMAIKEGLELDHDKQLHAAED